MYEIYKLVKWAVAGNPGTCYFKPFNADITNRNQGEHLDESIQTNEHDKHDKLKENLSQKTPRVNLTVADLNDQNAL